MKMKSYLSLIPISARNRRKQNRLTLACIILAVFLVTSVFSLAEIMTKSEEAAMIEKHGSHHVILSGVTREEAEQIAAQENVSASAWCRSFGEDVYEGYEIGGERVVLYGTEPAYVRDLRAWETEGAYPGTDDEVMLNADAKERLGVQAGDSVEIRTPAGSFGFTVSGFCVDEWAEDAKFTGVSAYMSVQALEQICRANQAEGAPAYYVRFAEGIRLREAIRELKTRYGLTDEAVEENRITMGMSGASSDRSINGLYVMAAVVFAMVLTAGVLMISSCMNSNISQRTKFFGMMRCIGASRGQIMRFVRLEALNWCRTAVPAGVGLGIAAAWLACVILKNQVGGEFSGMNFRLSVTGIVCGALVGVTTVLLAAHSPARRAASVSPVAAVSGSDGTEKKAVHAANTRIWKVESALGVHHAAASKKNLFLMSMSFAFTAALFLTFFAGLDFARKLLPSESDLNPDISIAVADQETYMDQKMKEEIGGIPGVEVSFGCAIRYGMPADVGGVPGSVNLVSYDDYLFSWTKDSVVSGSIREITGDTDQVLTVFNRDSRLNTGDTVTIGDTELTIACVVSEGIGTEDRPTLVCTEETFRRITGEDDYSLLGVQLAKDASEETVDAVRTIAGEYEFLDRREEDQEMKASFWVFRIAAYGFLAIISLITVFNIMNNISMSVSARMRQYGAMRAVGMSTGQMTRMIAAEAATYAVCGLMIGCAGGLYLHRLLMTKLIYSHFGGTWELPMEPLVIVAVLFGLSCVIAVYAPARRIRDMAVTETISEL